MGKRFINKDEDLMIEIQAGNILAFNILYKRYCVKLYKFAFSILKSSEEAENIVQDVFMSVWLSRHSIQKNSSIKYYIFTVAYHSAISVLRVKSKEAKFLDHLRNIPSAEHPSVDVELEYNELENRINKVIANLPPRQKEVYLLHKVEKLKYSEISEKMKISVNTIENHMSRALKTIRYNFFNF